MAYDDGFGQRPLGPDHPGRPDYPALPLPVPGYGTTTNTPTFNLPSRKILTGAKIFTDVKKANKFMKDRLVTEVDVTTYETSKYEGLLIVVYYEVGEDFDA